MPSLAMATSTPTESDVSSTTVQVTSIGGQTIFQPVGVKQSQQYLIVNPALHTSGGRIQIVTDKQQQEEALDAVRRREILARQPSYCKILNDLKEAESDESEDCQDQGDNTRGDRQGGQEEEVGQDLVMKGEAIEVVDGGQTTQTVVINGQQYQIVSPGSMEGLMVGGVSQVSQATTQPAPQPVSTVQYTTSTNGGHGTVFIPAGTQQQVVTVQGSTPVAGQARKREIRLMKNREAARECRNKKKEYIKCLENRVAVLENQNKALIEELKSLKELYTGQKN